MELNNNKNNNKENKYNGLRMGKVKFERLTNNNCYTYAINQCKDPYTKKPYRAYMDCQPGYLGGADKRDSDFHDYDFSNFMKYVKKDLKSIGYDIRKSTFEEYVEDKNAWKIAYCYCMSDYHFYRQNKNGTWSQKMGAYEVTKFDNSRNIIVNPETCNRGKYNTFVGFYIITPIKKH